MTKTIQVVFACLLVTACSSEQAADSAGQDTLTRRQRDSIIGASSIPGSRAVQRTIRGADAAENRAQALDSILRPR